MATRKPTTAQQLTALTQLVTDLPAKISQIFTAEPESPVAPGDEFPFWTRPSDDLTVPPTGPGGFTMGKDGYLSDCFNADEVRRRALYCIGFRGNRAYYSEPWLSKVWAEHETLKAKAVDSRNDYSAWKTHRGGIFNLVLPEVAFVANLTGEVALWADGRTGSGPQVALRYMTLDELLKQRSGASPDQGASG